MTFVQNPPPPAGASAWRRQGAVKAVRLLDADRDLARRLGSNAAEARAAAIAGAVALPRGRWNPAIAAKRIRGGFGLLVMRGLLMRDLEGSEALGAELLAEGDLLGPDDGTEERLLGLQPQWEILEPARLLVLDGAFAQRIAAFPALGSALVDRAHERARRTAIALASATCRASRTACTACSGTSPTAVAACRPTASSSLPLTQEQLGRLVGARRPTVSLALRSLRERGLVRRGQADEWILSHEPPVPEPSGLAAAGTRRAPRGPGGAPRRAASGVQPSSSPVGPERLARPAVEVEVVDVLGDQAVGEAERRRARR